MLAKEVIIPEGVEIKQEGNEIVVKGPKGELRRSFSHDQAKIVIREDKIVFDSGDGRRRSKAITGTFAALVNNMVKGVTSGYEARLKVVYSHFPVRLNVENGKLVIQNFLGEKKPRVAAILPETEVRIEKDMVIVTGIDKEKVGTTAARIENTAKVKGFDRRVFSDGVYITQKPQAAAEDQVQSEEGGE